MEEQDKLLDSANAIVREQSFFMKKAIEQENLRDALKYSSNMISELRTSQLSPRFYYELYMSIFQELQVLAAFFADKPRHGRKLTELYESVQHAGNILPRLYLVVTVGVAYIQSGEAPGAEILRDMAELCKGVQHPIRGLFLRYYVLQMTKDKLQLVSGENPKGLEEVTDFILLNFNETTRLWIRLQDQTSGQRDRAKRERERHELRILVGASLVRLSQLEGMTRQFYTDKVLPRILEQVVACKDPMAQQYLLDCTVQVFPDDFHLASLSLLLSTCSQTQKQVDLRPVLINLMNRLRNFLQSAEKSNELSDLDVFGLFRLHLERIMHRSSSSSSLRSEDDSDQQAQAPPAPLLNSQSVESPLEAANKACGSMLELFHAFLGFTLSLDPKRFDQVSIVHGMALSALDKNMEAIAGLPASSSEDRESEEDSDGPVWLSPLVEIIESTVSVVPLQVALALSQFGSLLSAIPRKYSKKISISLLDALLESPTVENARIGDVTTLARFMGVVESLLYDLEDSRSTDEEQTKMCRMVHNVFSGDIDVHFELLNTLRSFFGRGGPSRLRFTLPTLLSAAQQFALRVVAEKTESSKLTTTPKKVFQFIHNTCSALVQVSPDLAFQYWLSSGRLVDSLLEGGVFEPIAYEFFTQALIVFEEELTDSKTQASAIYSLVSTLMQTSRLSAENYEALATKTTQHAARLLKKPDQCRAVLACSHLFWSVLIQDSKRVLECLQRSLKIADVCAQASPANSHELFLEALNKYLYYYQVVGLSEISPLHISNLLALCKEHALFAAHDGCNNYLQHTIDYIKEKREIESSPLRLVKLPCDDAKENVTPAPTVDTTAELK